MTNQVAGTDTKSRIVEAARKLFWERGYGSTGIAQILREAGANAGSLYHFFPTKEELLLEVLESYKSMLGPEVMEPAFARASDPVDRVFAVLHGYRAGLVATGCAGGCPIGNLALEVSDSHPAARRKISENFEAWCDAIRRCLDGASDRLPEGVDRTQLASFVLTVMEGAVMQARAHRRVEPFDAAVAQLRDYLERLLSDGTSWAEPRGKRSPE